MHPDLRLPSHESSPVRLKSKKTAFHIVFGRAAA
jgi:hypothetical protein